MLRIIVKVTTTEGMSDQKRYAGYGYANRARAIESAITKTLNLAEVEEIRSVITHTVPPKTLMSMG